MEISYDKLPAHMRSGAQLFVEDGVRPGDFLMAVFQNDLKGAFQRADHINQHLIAEYVEWLHWEVPAPAQGSPEKVKAWIDQGGLKGQK